MGTVGGSFLFKKLPKKFQRGDRVGRNPKLTLVNKKHLTKDEKRIREEKENKLFKDNRVDKIVPPSWLCKKAKDLFKEIAAELIEKNMLSNLDLNCLSLYCDYYIKFLDINKKIKSGEELIEYTNKAGATNLVENPSLKIKNKYFEIVNKLSKELGLTPTARTRFTMLNTQDKETKRENFYGDFLNEQG